MIISYKALIVSLCALTVVVGLHADAIKPGWGPGSDFLNPNKPAITPANAPRTGAAVAPVEPSPAEAHEDGATRTPAADDAQTPAQ